MHRGLTDGSALDRPQYYEIILSLDTILTFSYTPLISEPIRKQNSKNVECIESVLKMSNAICALQGVFECIRAWVSERRIDSFIF